MARYRGGLGHDFKAGVNFINEPHLFTTFNGGRRSRCSHTPRTTSTGRFPPCRSATATPRQPADEAARAVLPGRLAPQRQADPESRPPLRRHDRLPDRPVSHPNFVALQAAGRSGRLNGLIGFEDFGKDPREDYNNIQPRLGLVFDVAARATTSSARRGASTPTSATRSSNILIGAADASPLGFGPTFAASNPNGLRNPDGSFFSAGQPLTNIASLNEVRPGSKPLFGSGPISPRLEQPESRQSVFGWTHQINGSTIVNADYVHIDGRKLNIRPRLNTRPNGGPSVSPIWRCRRTTPACGRRSAAASASTTRSFSARGADGRRGWTSTSRTRWREAGATSATRLTRSMPA